MRQFIFDGKTEKNGSIVVKGKDFRYLTTVLRLKINDKIDVRLKTGVLELMEIVAIESKTAILQPVSRETKAVTQGVSAFSVENQSRVEREFWLFQFMPKPQKMDLIIRQATECGISVIVPIISEYSVSQEGKGRLDRWQRIIKEARQQSGSPISTRIVEPLNVTEAAKLWKEAKSKEEAAESCVAFILHESSEIGDALESFQNCKNVKKIALSVGCEGGFSPKEFDILKEVGFLPLHFATNVLRAETAALYGIAVLQQTFK